MNHVINCMYRVKKSNKININLIMRNANLISKPIIPLGPAMVSNQ